jgi:hypothetical protein
VAQQRRLVTSRDGLRPADLAQLVRTAGLIHGLAAGSLSTVDGEAATSGSRCSPTPARWTATKQLAAVEQLTRLVAAATRPRPTGGGCCTPKQHRAAGTAPDQPRICHRRVDRARVRLGRRCGSWRARQPLGDRVDSADDRGACSRSQCCLAATDVCGVRAMPKSSPSSEAIGRYLGRSRREQCWVSVEDSEILLGPPRSGKDCIRSFLARHGRAKTPSRGQ